MKAQQSGSGTTGLDNHHFTFKESMMAKRIVIETGQKYGKLTVIRETDPRGYDRYALVQCDCGSDPKEVKHIAMRNGRIVACGCSRGLNKTLTVSEGDKYGRLTVIREAGQKGKDRRVFCSCSCGSEDAEYSLYHLRCGTKSCGCLTIEVGREIKTIHGKSGSGLYRVWAGMRNRCNNRHGGDYPQYGLRGIRVCDEWSEFTVFDSWAMSSGYRKGLEIDRRDTNRGYEPSNCRFVTRVVNTQNRRSSRIWHVAGSTYESARVAAEANDVSVGTIKHWAGSSTPKKHILLGHCWSVLKYPINQKTSSTGSGESIVC